MLRALLLVGVAAAAAGCGDSQRREPAAAARALDAQAAVGYPLYWVGASFDGLALDDVLRGPRRTSFVYGTCDPSGSDTGCAPPLEIQVSSICDDNALVLDIRPDASRRARGTTVLDYGEAGRVALDAGASHVTVSSEPARSLRVIAALRRVVGSQRVRRGLPRPRCPRAYVDELRRVRDAYARLGDVRAVRTALRISKSAVRFRLRLARELGAERLRRRGGWARGDGCQRVELASGGRHARASTRCSTALPFRAEPAFFVATPAPWRAESARHVRGDPNSDDGRRRERVLIPRVARALRTRDRTALLLAVAVAQTICDGTASFNTRDSGSGMAVDLRNHRIPRIPSHRTPTRPAESRLVPRRRPGTMSN